MKRISSIIYVIFVTSTLLSINLSSQRITAQLPPNYYHNLGISLNYPSDWLAFNTQLGGFFVSPNLAQQFGQNMPRILVEKPIDVSPIPMDTLLYIVLANEPKMIPGFQLTGLYPIHTNSADGF